MLFLPPSSIPSRWVFVCHINKHFGRRTDSFHLRMSRFPAQKAGSIIRAYQLGSRESMDMSHCCISWGGWYVWLVVYKYWDNTFS